jgi:uncharacterized protein with GYD domain
MATKAYFLIRTAAEAAQNGHAEWIRDLEAMPEVQCVEHVSGQYDLMATVEAPITAVLVAHKILANGWVKHLHILRMEEIPRKEPRLSVARQRELIRARRGEMQRFLRTR